MAVRQAWACSAVLTLMAACQVAPSAPAQTALGRGARDPIQVEVIVVRGQWHFTGAGVPRTTCPSTGEGRNSPRRESSRCRIDNLHDEGLLQGPRVMVDPPLLPLQLPGRSPTDLGRIRSAADRRRPPRSAAWGFCDRDYPRQEIVSPYRFTTAGEHYAALLERPAAGAALSVYTQATLPDWSGAICDSGQRPPPGSMARSFRCPPTCRC